MNQGKEAFERGLATQKRIKDFLKNNPMSTAKIVGMSANVEETTARRHLTRMLYNEIYKTTIRKNGQKVSLFTLLPDHEKTNSCQELLRPFKVRGEKKLKSKKIHNGEKQSTKTVKAVQIGMKRGGWEELMFGPAKKSNGDLL